MTQAEFEKILASVSKQLTAESRHKTFASSKEFENRVREVTQEHVKPLGISLDFDPELQAFPDVAINEFGIEVKFTEHDTWRSVANSVLETNRIETVKKIYVIFGKMGGVPEVRWGEYEKCVMHVRTSHVPRFELEMSAEKSLFETMGVSYDQFRGLPMEGKMQHIRKYARGRLQPGERLWWLDESPDSEFSLPMQARLYTSLPQEEKVALRAEAALLCPQIVRPSTARGKYDDAVLYLMTYRGVLCHQARDLFTAGSVANPLNDDMGGRYIERSLKAMEKDIELAAERLDDALFVEYWGESLPPAERIAAWLKKADGFARDWMPSLSLFRDYQKRKGLK